MLYAPEAAQHMSAVSAIRLDPGRPYLSRASADEQSVPAGLKGFVQVQSVGLVTGLKPQIGLGGCPEHAATLGYIRVYTLGYIL